MQIKFEVGSRKLKEFKLDGFSFLCSSRPGYLLLLPPSPQPPHPRYRWALLTPLPKELLRPSTSSLCTATTLVQACAIPFWVPATDNYPPFQTPPSSLHTAVRVVFLKQIWSYHTTASNDLVTPLFLGWKHFFHMTLPELHDRINPPLTSLFQTLTSPHIILLMPGSLDCFMLQTSITFFMWAFSCCFLGLG